MRLKTAQSCHDHLIRRPGCKSELLFTKPWKTSLSLSVFCRPTRYIICFQTQVKRFFFSILTIAIAAKPKTSALGQYFYSCDRICTSLNYTSMRYISMNHIFMNYTSINHITMNSISMNRISMSSISMNYTSMIIGRIIGFRFIFFHRKSLRLSRITVFRRTQSVIFLRRQSSTALQTTCLASSIRSSDSLT